MSSLSYLNRRLATAQAARELPASVRFDLAASSLDDDTLEQTVAMFGGPPYGASGFGMSDILREYTSRDARFVPVTDLETYQQNLVGTGYLPPDYPVSGVYDDLTHNAGRRAERDATDLLRSGAKIGSVTTAKFFDYLNGVVPQGMLEAVYGTAKGLVSSVADVVTNPIQAAEESGIAGGAITGAIAGSFFGPVGAGVGAVAGGLIGGIADFFGDDEGEEDQSFADKIWDSLSPWDEYKETGAKHFFSLLDTVMIGRMGLKSVVGTNTGPLMGVRGVQRALAGPSLTPATLARPGAGRFFVAGTEAATTELGAFSVKQAGFREAFRMAAPGTVQKSIVNRLTTKALERPLIGGAAVGGTINALPDLIHGEFGDAAGKFVSGAGAGAAVGALGKAFAPGALQKGIDLMGKAPLMRLHESGAMQVTRAAYTSLATIGTTGRIASDITPDVGEPDPFAKGITEAKTFTTSKAWDVLDLTAGLLLFPNRLLPLRPKEVGDALRAMDNRHVLMPFYRAHATVTRQKVSDKVIEEVDTLLGNGNPTDRVQVATEANRIYFDKAISVEAQRLAELEGRGGSIVDRYRINWNARRKRAEIIARVNQEAEEFGTSSTARALLDDIISKPREMESEIVNWQGRNTTLENLVDERQAQDVLDIASTTFVEGPKTILASPDVAVKALLREKAQEQTGLSIAERVEALMPDEILAKQKQLARHEPAIPAGFRVMPAVEGQVVTKQMVGSLKARYEQAAQEFTDAQQVLKRSPDSSLAKEQLTRTGKELDLVINELRGLGSTRDWDDILNAARPSQGPSYTTSSKLTDTLDEISEFALVENTEMTQALRDAGLDRYIAVNTGENMLVTADVPKLLRYEGIDQVVLHPVREHIASIALKPDDFRDLGPMRYWSIVGQLDKVAADIGIGMDGRGLTDRIYDFTRLRNDPEWAKKHLKEVVDRGRLGIVIARQTVRKSRSELFKADPRDLSLNDIIQGLQLDDIGGLKYDTYEAADRIKRGLMIGASFGADMHHPLQTLRELGRGLRIEGLTEFQDFARTLRAPVHRWAPDEGFFAKAKVGSWGYVPNNARRTHMAAQFTFSPYFDASRRMEALSFGLREGIPARITWAPKRSILNDKDGFTDPLTGTKVYGPDAIAARNRFIDEVVYERNTIESLDDIEFKTNQAGLTGMNPKEVEASQLFWMAQAKAAKGPLSKADMDELRERLLTINRYGTGQSALAKSAHFIFFPFLFQAKQLQLLQDVVLGAPVRSALVHEGFRRWYGIDGDPGLKEDFEQTMEQHLPVAKELSKLNNLSWGIGAGRFFLEGFADSVSADGKVALDSSTYNKITQGIGNFLLPGGIHTPAREAAGKFVDLRQFFVPVVIYDDGSQKRLADQVEELLRGLVPAYRDLDRFIYNQGKGVLWEQFAAVSEGGSGYWQMGEYLDNKFAVDQLFEQVATNAGYSSWASLRQSPNGAGLAAAYEQAKTLLRTDYPRGAELATRFTDTDEVKANALVQIAGKQTRTAAEDAIAGIGTLEEELKDIAAEKGLTQVQMFQFAAASIRQFALKYVDDPQFMNLWEGLGFARTYGPLRVVAA